MLDNAGWACRAGWKMLDKAGQVHSVWLGRLGRSEGQDRRSGGGEVMACKGMVQGHGSCKDMVHVRTFPWYSLPLPTFLLPRVLQAQMYWLTPMETLKLVV